MKAKELERQHGKPLGEILIEAFNQHRTQAAVARELGVSQGTVSLWIKLSGLAKQEVYTLTDKARAHQTGVRS